MLLSATPPAHARLFDDQPCRGRLPSRKTIATTDATLARLFVNSGESALFTDGAGLAERLAAIPKRHPSAPAA